MKNYLLAIDIGNTNITLGVFKNNKLIRVFRVATRLNANQIKLQIGKNLHRYTKDINSAIICSVVPGKTIIVQKILKQLLKIKPKIIGKDIQVPIKNLYKNPAQVGQDRLVVAYAAKVLYGAPAVIIDFGTATTFDYINKKGQYCGGVIAPGIEISIDALFERTALLPKIKMRTPKSLIGKSTYESIISGTSFGLAYMCDGLIRAFKKTYGKNLKVVATGGLALFFKKRCNNIDIVDKDLILKGIVKL